MHLFYRGESGVLFCHALRHSSIPVSGLLLRGLQLSNEACVEGLFEIFWCLVCEATV